jgi:hypothetical protein
MATRAQMRQKLKWRWARLVQQPLLGAVMTTLTAERVATVLAIGPTGVHVREHVEQVRGKGSFWLMLLRGGALNAAQLYLRSLMLAAPLPAQPYRSATADSRPTHWEKHLNTKRTATPSLINFWDGI